MSQSTDEIQRLFWAQPNIIFVSSISLNFCAISNHYSRLQKAFYNKLSAPICKTTSASKKLSQALQDVKTLQEEGDFFKRHHWRSCWFIWSGEDVWNQAEYGYAPRGRAQNLRRHRCVYSSDFWSYRFPTTTDKRYPYDKRPSKYRQVYRTHRVPYFQHIFELHYREPKAASSCIPMGTNVAPEIANLTMYADEAEFIDELMRRGER